MIWLTLPYFVRSPSRIVLFLLQEVRAQREVEEVVQRLAAADDFQIVGCPFPRITQKASQLLWLIMGTDFSFSLAWRMTSSMAANQRW